MSAPCGSVEPPTVETVLLLPPTNTSASGVTLELSARANARDGREVPDRAIVAWAEESGAAAACLARAGKGSRTVSEQ